VTKNVKKDEVPLAPPSANAAPANCKTFSLERSDVSATLNVEGPQRLADDGHVAELRPEDLGDDASSGNSTEPRPLVFLDFDDVLATSERYNSFQLKLTFEHAAQNEFQELWDNLFDARACKNLRAVHTEFHPWYVITSSWTGFLNKEQISEALARCELSFVIENLHPDWSAASNEEQCRLNAIKSWLDSHNGWSRFVILDDRQSGQSLEGSHLESWCVFCEPWRGFQEKELSAARGFVVAIQLA
jgi:hypothetical protein